MKKSCSALYHLLRSIHGLRVAHAPAQDPVIEHVRLWRSQPVERGCLYIVDGTSCPPAADVAPAADAAPAAVLICGAVDSLAGSPWDRMEGAVIVCEDEACADELFEEATDLLLSLEMWDGALKDSLFADGTLEKLFAVGKREIPELLSLVDPDLRIIVGYSFLQTEQARSEQISRDIDGNPHLANATVEELLLMDDYAHVALEQEVFLYPRDPDEACFVCGNVIADGENRARLVAQCPMGQETFDRAGLVRLFDHFLRYMRQAFLRDWRDEHELDLNDDLHRMLRLLLDSPGQANLEGMPAVAERYGWAGDDTFLVMRARFLEGAYWESMANYICGQVEQAVPGSAAATVSGEIAWVCDLSGQHGMDEKVLSEKLAYIVRDYTFKMGISRRMERVERIATGFLEAHIALEVGSVRDPHLWYYRFDDYAPDYLLARMTGELPADELIHPGIARLERYDAAHGTEYLPTLRLYFDCGFNVTDAAERAFVHRTTFSRRLERIETLGAIDVRDAGTRRYLTLSFWMLDMGKTSGAWERYPGRAGDMVYPDHLLDAASGIGIDRGVHDGEELPGNAAAHHIA